MIELYINITLTVLIYTTIIIKCLFTKNKLIISKHYIKQWFDNNITLTQTKKITRTSDLFNSYKRYLNVTETNKQDLVLFGKLLKNFVKEEGLPLEYKKTSYAGYTNIKTFI